jgi:TolB-like protein
MSGDPEQEYFADGIVEDVITALSRFKSLFVMARNSSFAYKGKAVDIKQVGSELGVRYVLEGSVRKAGGRVRITGQLIEAATGNHLWADKFDGALEDIFDLQDQVTSSVVGAVAPKLDQAEIERARRKPVENLDAYDFFLKGMAQMHVSNKEALRLFHRAIELDPEFATPYGLAARCYSFRGVLGRIADRESEIAETRRFARRVAAIGQDDALALTWAGHALAEFCREYEPAEALLDQALIVNPNLAIGWVNRGAVSMYLGHHEPAIQQILRGMRLSPIDLETYRAEFLLSACYLCQSNCEKALYWGRRSFAHRPGMSNIALIAVSALCGNTDEARQLAIETLQMLPRLTVSDLRRNMAFRRPEDLDRLCEGWRLAGLPE